MRAVITSAVFIYLVLQNPRYRTLSEADLNLTLSTLFIPAITTYIICT